MHACYATCRIPCSARSPSQAVCGVCRQIQAPALVDKASSPPLSHQVDGSGCLSTNVPRGNNPGSSTACSTNRAGAFSQHTTSAERADASRRAPREDRTPTDWSDEGETEGPRLCSTARKAFPAVVIGGRELLIDSSNESSELSDVNPTASRSRPRRSHAAKEHRQPLQGQCFCPEASAISIAAF